MVRIYSHYSVIDGKKITFYRHSIRELSFTDRSGKKKWTAYKFSKNAYDIWMPTHLKRICSMVDDLSPDLDFEVSEQSEPGKSGLSQWLESHWSVQRHTVRRLSIRFQLKNGRKQLNIGKSYIYSPNLTESII